MSILPTFVALVLLCGSVARASDVYAPEISAMRERQRLYASVLNQKHEALAEFAARWKSIEDQAAPLNPYLEQLGKHYVPKVRADSYQQQLQFMIARSVDIEQAIFHLRLIQESVRSDLNRAEEALKRGLFKEEDPIYRAHEEKKAESLAQIQALEVRLISEQARVSALSERLNDVREKALIRSEIHQNQLTSQKMQLVRAIDEYRLVLIRLKLKLQGAQFRRERNSSEEILSGARWLMKASLVHLGSLAFSSEQRVLVESFRASARDTIERMEVMVARSAPTLKSSATFRFSTARISVGDGPDEEPISEIPRDSHGDGGKSREFEIDGERFKSSEPAFADGKIFQEAVSTADPEFSKAILIDDGKVEHENLERGLKLLGRFNGEANQKIRDQIRANGNYSKEFSDFPDSGSGERSLPTETGTVRSMVERAREKTRNPDHQAELDQLASELDRYQGMQLHFDQRLAEAIDQAVKSPVSALGLWNGFSQTPIAAPQLDPLPADPVTREKLEKEFIDSVRKLMDVALGIVLDTPYDIVNFVSAVAFDQTLLGEPVGYSDKVVLAAASVLPLVPGGVLRSGATVVGVSSQIKKGAGIAGHNPVKPGKLHDLPLGDGTIADTFRSGTYISYSTEEPVKLYRVQSGPNKSGMNPGRFWSRNRPESGTQAAIDGAIHSDFGNEARYMVEIEVPKGVEIHEGVAGPYKGMVGGGSQVYIDTPQKDWISNPGTRLGQ